MTGVGAGGDTITLTIPRERAFHHVAHLVLGGLGVRLGLTVDDLEDLQVALGELLDADEPGQDVTLELVVGADALRAEVGPFTGPRLRAALEEEDQGLGLRRVLSAVVDSVELTERDGRQWVRLTKSTEAATVA